MLNSEMSNSATSNSATSNSYPAPPQADSTSFYWQGWLVHLYTALGLPCALLALLACARGQAQATFAWLLVAFVIDSTDGMMARKLKVEERIPDVSGRKLDDIIDYINYVLIPVFFIHRFELVPEWGTGVLALVLVASGYGFCSGAAKTDDGYFTGFPSYWNVVAFYLYFLHLPGEGAALLLAVLALMVFWPVKYLYPSKTPIYKTANIGLAVIWFIQWTLILLDPAPAPWLVWSSLFYPAYYMGLSFFLHFSGRT